MSYCVNCGVKLEQSLKVCPLCHTPVINPNELTAMASSSLPFAQQKGEVEPMSKHDGALWLSIVFASISISCFLLNLTVFHTVRWSIPVIDTCILLWILFCPRMFWPQFPLPVSLSISGASILLFEYALTFLTKSDRWFYELAFPITALLLLLVALFGFLYRFVSRALLATVLYFFIDVGILCVGIECLIDVFLGHPISLLWSAIVLSVCTVICAALIAALSIARLRESIRRRLHF